MITEFDLQEAIAECKGERNPTSQTCIKLAAFLTIYDHMFGVEKDVQQPVLYSRSSGDTETERVIEYDGESDFAQAVNGRNADEIWPVMDELMDALKVLNKRLYEGVMQKIT